MLFLFGPGITDPASSTPPSPALYPLTPGNSNMIFLTFGKLTLGTMTLCKALGASFGGFLGSPPGWYLWGHQYCSSREVTFHPYWYLKCSLASSPLVLSVCHGKLPGTMLTFASEVADVGLRPGKLSIELIVPVTVVLNYRNRIPPVQKLQT